MLPTTRNVVYANRNTGVVTATPKCTSPLDWHDSFSFSMSYHSCTYVMLWRLAQLSLGGGAETDCAEFLKLKRESTDV